MRRGAVVLGLVFLLASSGSHLAQEIQRFPAETSRVSTRIAYFGQNASAGQLVIDYGQPEWKAEYGAQFDALTKGKRWRLGNNFWTTLDTQLDLAVAGTRVPSGYYYLVLDRSPGDEWFLVLLDPKEIRAKKLDAFAAGQTTGGLKAPLMWVKADEVAEKLTIKLIPEEGDIRKATLDIRWGDHRLTAAIEVSL